MKAIPVGHKHVTFEESEDTVTDTIAEGFSIRPGKDACCPDKTLHVICTGCGHDFGSIVKLQEEARQEIEKAYGGCHFCYGKGYSTYRHSETDGRTVTPPKTEMVFCEKCDRGKQLKELITAIQKGEK